MDLTTTDSIKDQIWIDGNDDTIIDYDEYENIREQVFNQITQFNNLGIDLLTDVHISIRRKLFVEIINYVDENYIHLVDIDNILISNVFIDEFGYYIYLFLSVDCFNSIFPNFLSVSGINNYSQFEHFIKKSSYQNYKDVKNNILKSVQQIIDPLMKLQNIDPSIIQDSTYKLFLKRLTYEVDLVDYGDFTIFVENFMHPLFRKNFSEILWRVL